MLDQVGQARTKSGPVGASWGQLGQAAASCAPPAPTGNGLASCWEPNRSQIGTRPAQIGARLETGRSPAGASLGQGRGKAGTSSPLSRSGRRSGWHRQPAPATCIWSPNPTAQSGDWSEKPDRARAGARTGLVRAGKEGQACSDGWLVQTA